MTGRVFVMISRDAARELRVAIGRVGNPFFDRDVEKLAPGQPAVIDATDIGDAGGESGRDYWTSGWQC